MPKGYITVGVSASGKTTWAESEVQAIEGVNLNRDDIRSEIIGSRVQWKSYKFKDSVEKRVTEIQKERAEAAVEVGQDIIISDTNLNPKTRQRWESFFKKAGYEVVVKEFPVTLEEAWKRNTHRENGISHSVVYRQYQQWLDYKGRKVYEPNLQLPPAIIFDIDGTIANMKGVRGPFDWEVVDQDHTHQLIVAMLFGYQRQGYQIVLLSGRDSCCRELTEMWLSDQSIENYELYMRPEGSYEKDTVVKERLFWDHLANTYKVVGVVDDRPSVVRLWHELGIQNVICVGNPWEEF